MPKDPALLSCPYAKKCGACQYATVPYADQLRLKQGRLVRLLGRLGHVEPIIGMEDPYHYRNKIQAAFRMRSGKVISGVYQSSSRHIIEVDSCLLEDTAAAPILATIRRLAASMKIRPYDIPSGKGFLRHVLIRRARSTEQIMVVLVTTPGTFREERPFINELVRRHPEITTVVRNINASDIPLRLGRESIVLHGPGYITDELLGLQFRLSPRSFYQVNTTQTAVLYSKAREFAGLTGKERVLDAYCGTGTIGLSMAAGAHEIIGVELNADAVADAKENAAHNQIDNATFYAEDAGAFMCRAAEKGEHFDVVITDPPRAGCSRSFLQALITLEPSRIVYVSCEPETLARDLRVLRAAGYRARRICPVDMFPFTTHVETVVLLTKTQDGKDEFLFRKARREEANTVYALYRRAVGREFCAWYDEYPGMQEISEDLKAEQLYVLTHKGTVVGAISIVPEHELDDFSCWQCKDGTHREIARFVLDEAFTGQGLSQRILKEIISELGSMGCRAVHLSVAEKNLPAYKAYLKAGFEKVGEADLYGGHYFLMEKYHNKDRR